MTVDIHSLLDNKEELEKILETCSPALRREIQWRLSAREKQLLPETYWDLAIIRAGRGWGKSRVGAEWVRRKIEVDGAMSGLVIGSTTTKVNDILVEGKSGILACCPDAVYKVNKAQIIWPNGAKVYLQTAEKKEGARGYSVEFVLGDEMAEWPYQKTTWEHIVAAVREPNAHGTGYPSQKLITSTPKRSAYMSSLEDTEESLVVINGSTYENKDNLTPQYLKALEKQWAGTSLYKQEILGEILTQVDGALFQETWFKHELLPQDVDFDKVVVAVDPSVSVSETSDETGIIVVARLADHYFVLADKSGKHSVDTWANLALDQARIYGCEIVVEKNQGGNLLEKNIKDKDPHQRVKTIHAIASKEDRLGSIVGYYEKGEVSHIVTPMEEDPTRYFNPLAKLEEQLTTWTPDSKDSPDRGDGLSHAIRYLAGKRTSQATISMPKSFRLKKVKLDPKKPWRAR